MIGDDELMEIGRKAILEKKIINLVFLRECVEVDGGKRYKLFIVKSFKARHVRGREDQGIGSGERPAVGSVLLDEGRHDRCGRSSAVRSGVGRGRMGEVGGRESKNQEQPIRSKEIRDTQESASRG